MKTKLLALLLALVMVVSILASCDFGNQPDDDDDDKQTCTSHVDKNPADGKCDACGADTGKKPGGNTDGPAAELPAVTWTDKVDIIFQMTDNSNGNELRSGCRRFLSGESDATGFVEANAKDRNTNAYNYANVNVSYLYYPDSSGYGWGAGIIKMNQAATSDTEKGRPDIFTNFVYDMVSASLMGSFNNLYNNTYASVNVKDGETKNYFAFAKNGKYDINYKDTGDGYMIEYMQSLTLSENKMYLLASDYFTDLVRAFFAVPVNIGLLESAVEASNVEGAYNYDYDGDGTYEIEDFYELVQAGKWNYEAVKGFSDDVYKNPSDTTNVLGDGVYGFALGAGGLGASGILYTTSVIVINRKVETKVDSTDPLNPVEYQDYTFWYPTEAEPLLGFVENLDSLFRSTGVVSINTDAERGPVNTNEGDAEEAVRYAFAEGKVLFGGIVCVGSLEDSVYGNMADNGGSGFGVVPVPLYRTNYTDENGAVKVDKYLTQIHNIGKVGAIAVRSTKYAQCSAFLNYQSLNSSDILDDYYDFTLKTDAAGDVEGNAEMLDYIRANVRSSFDKAFEDAIARHAQLGGNSTLNSNKWHNMILAANFNLTRAEMDSLYDTWTVAKGEALVSLEDSYGGLPA